MVRLWILMFNEGGIDALASKPRSGRPRKIKLERLRDLLVPVLEEPAKAAQQHWTGVKVAWLAQGTVGHQPGLSHDHSLSPTNSTTTCGCPSAGRSGKAEAFLEELHTLRKDPRVELWYGDECGVEGDPRPRRRWSARGSRPQVPYLGEHIRANVIECASHWPKLCHDLRRRRYRRLPVLPRLPRRGDPSRNQQTPRAYPRQRFGTKRPRSTGITSSVASCPATAPTSIPSNDSGSVSRRTTSLTSLLALRRNSPSAY